MHLREKTMLKTVSMGSGGRSCICRPVWLLQRPKVMQEREGKGG